VGSGLLYIQEDGKVFWPSAPFSKFLMVAFWSTGGLDQVPNSRPSLCGLSPRLLTCHF
jgi:hypothetical protein